MSSTLITGLMHARVTRYIGKKVARLLRRLYIYKLKRYANCYSSIKSGDPKLEFLFNRKFAGQSGKKLWLEKMTMNIFI